MTDTEVYYGDYLQLDKILNAQRPESRKKNIEAHDEMLFIIIHQVYELWFKQILYEVSSVMRIFAQENINDSSPDLQIAVHRLKRVVKILKICVQQIDVIESMTPLDFLDFRDMLRPASGFQSIQFKILEAKLGLRMDDRHGKAYYVSQLREADVQKIKKLEGETTFIDQLNDWLERMPFWKDEMYWDKSDFIKTQEDIHPFWQRYQSVYEKSLITGEQSNVEAFQATFFSSEKNKGKLSSAAKRTALFIMLYRDYPLLQMPFQLLNTLLDIDETLATWRFRHMNMVHRMIGTRVGTGGSSGKDYLSAALNKHYIFKEIAELTSFLVNRNQLPALSTSLMQALSYGKKN